MFDLISSRSPSPAKSSTITTGHRPLCKYAPPPRRPQSPPITSINQHASSKLPMQAAAKRIGTSGPARHLHPKTFLATGFTPPPALPRIALLPGASQFPRPESIPGLTQEPLSVSNLPRNPPLYGLNANATELRLPLDVAPSSHPHNWQGLQTRPFRGRPFPAAWVVPEPPHGVGSPGTQAPVITEAPRQWSTWSHRGRKKRMTNCIQPQRSGIPGPPFPISTTNIIHHHPGRFPLIPREHTPPVMAEVVRQPRPLSFLESLRSARPPHPLRKGSKGCHSWVTAPRAGP